jgi:ABC-type spermidine/putrescine transport system permease subunit II
MKNRLRQIATRWIGFAALAAALAGMYVPVLMIFAYSFNASRIGTVWTGFSLRGYRELFEQVELWNALLASCAIAAAASSLSVVAGTMAALGLKHWPLRARAAAQGVLALPLVTPDVIIALALALFFSALQIPQGWGTVIAAHCVFGISYAFVVLYSAVRDFDESLVAAALDCGASPWQAYRRVVLPILSPSLVVAWLLVFALSFDDFLITFMTKGPGADTLPIKIFSQMRFGIQPQTNALFTILFMATLCGAVLATRLMPRHDHRGRESLAE